MSAGLTPKVPVSLVSIDLDGTLIPHSSTVRVLARALGHEREVEEAERALQAGALDDVTIADRLGKRLTGVPLSTIRLAYEQTPRIGGIRETIDDLHRKGAYVILASITWKFFVEMFATEYGFDDYCGTAMAMNGTVLTGRVTSHFTGLDKARFFSQTVSRLGLTADRSVAIGDSRSDHEVFRIAGVSVAINADRTTQLLADHSIETMDLREVLKFV